MKMLITRFNWKELFLRIFAFIGMAFIIIALIFWMVYLFDLYIKYLACC